MEPCNADGSGRIYYYNRYKKSSSSVVCSTNKATGSVHYSSFANLSEKLKKSKYYCVGWKENKELEENPLKTLRDICIDFVVSNLHLLDSLEDFPQIVGKDLFEACIQFGYFQVDNCGNWRKALNIFIDAYNEEVLSILNLPGKSIFLASCFDNIAPYIHLQEINFSSCKIGDDHEVLKHIGALHHLKKLNLSKNNVSCSGIRNLTMKHRRSLCGLEKLEVLRLDGNADLKVDILPYLETLHNLNVIVVDDIPKITENLKPLKSRKFNKCPHSIRFHCNAIGANMTDTIGKGWAVPLISSDIEQLETKLKKRKTSSKSYKAKPFYKQKSLLETSQPTTPAMARNQLMICCCFAKLPNINKEQFKTNDIPRKRQSDNDNSSELPAKRQCISKRWLHVNPDILSLYFPDE